MKRNREAVKKINGSLEWVGVWGKVHILKKFKEKTKRFCLKFLLMASLSAQKI
jgi:hypothetical protein